MNDIDFQPFLDALTAHNYVLFGALFVGFLVALMKQGWASRWLATKLPAAGLPYLSVVLGSLLVSSAEVVAGKPVKMALVHGFLAGIMAIFGHEVVIEGARGGKEIVPARGVGDGPKVPPLPMLLLVLLALMLAGCGQPPKTVVQEIVTGEQAVCVIARAALPLPQVMMACGIADTLADLTQRIVDAVLSGQKQAVAEYMKAAHP